MKKMLLTWLLGVASLSAWAVDIGISAKEAYEKAQGGDDNVLFVDVRDTVEIMFIGFTDSVHANIPPHAGGPHAVEARYN